MWTPIHRTSLFIMDPGQPTLGVKQYISDLACFILMLCLQKPVGVKKLQSKMRWHQRQNTRCTDGPDVGSLQCVLANSGWINCKRFYIYKFFLCAYMPSTVYRKGDLNISNQIGLTNQIGFIDPENHCLSTCWWPVLNNNSFSHPLALIGAQARPKCGGCQFDDFTCVGLGWSRWKIVGGKISISSTGFHGIIFHNLEIPHPTST